MASRSLRDDKCDHRIRAHPTEYLRLLYAGATAGVEKYAPQISNTEQGGQFTGACRTDVLTEHQIAITMDRSFLSETYI